MVADVTYIDGVRVGETVLNRTRVKDPVNQVIARGTQTIDDYFASTGGRFIWPADGGYFYGSRVISTVSPTLTPSITRHHGPCLQGGYRYHRPQLRLELRLW